MTYSDAIAAHEADDTLDRYRADVAAYAHWCDAEGWTLAEFIQVLEKPWHFTAEIDAARALADATSMLDLEERA
jgi:hypothetical protein